MSLFCSVTNQCQTKAGQTLPVSETAAFHYEFQIFGFLFVGKTSFKFISLGS